MPDLHRVRLVAMREWTTRLRQRTFRITTIVQVIFILIGASVPTIGAVFLGDDDGTDASTILVLDQVNASIGDRLTPYLSTDGSAEAVSEEGSIEARATSGTVEELRAQVEQGDVDGGLIVTRNEAQDLAFTFVNADGASDMGAQRIFAAASAITLEDRLQRSGLDQQQARSAVAPPLFTVEAARAQDATDDNGAITGARYAIGLAFTVLMFMAIMLYGTWVAQGVVEEKSSRIMEIMINAATPRDLLAGKVLGIGLAGLTQLLPMLVVGGIVFAFQERIIRALGGDLDVVADIDFGGLTAAGVGWFLVYFLLGFILYASMYAALGSLVSRQEEVNQAISPMMTVMFVGYFAAIFSLNAPDNPVAKVLSIFPLTSPFVMISRTIIGNAEAWEIATSLALLALTVVLAILFAGRVYRVGVLMYGQKPSWKTVFNAGTQQAAR
ncbi:MAG TPA: ABC transporter permease [Thermomicrobiales bacterium]|nr:ABC transporter permease [Thermomicrobiales bacterium]